MSEEYCFEFPGTRDAFSKKLGMYPDNDRRYFYFDDYIVERAGENYRFGVERAGHSGGYWFSPEITEREDKLVLRGKLRYSDPWSEETGEKEQNKLADKLESILLFILLLPLIVIIKVVQWTRRLLHWVARRPLPKVLTTEEHLFDLMENYLGCTLIH